MKFQKAQDDWSEENRIGRCSLIHSNHLSVLQKEPNSQILDLVVCSILNNTYLSMTRFPLDFDVFLPIFPNTHQK